MVTCNHKDKPWIRGNTRFIKIFCSFLDGIHWVGTNRLWRERPQTQASGWFFDGMPVSGSESSQLDPEMLYLQSVILSRDPTEGDCSFIYAYSISRPSEVTTVFSVWWHL